MSSELTTKKAATVQTVRRKTAPSTASSRLNVKKPTARKAATSEASEARVNKNADPIAAQAEQYAAMSAARSKFVAVTIGLGWRLAITVLVPLFVGVKLDDHFHTSPSYTLAALFLALFCSAMVVWDSVKAVNRDTTLTDLAKKKDATTTKENGVTHA